MDPSEDWTEAIRGAARASAKFAWRAMRRASQRPDIKRLDARRANAQLILGAGHQRRPGWISTDILPRGLDVLYLDVSKPFPFADGGVDRIYAEHVIEHVSLPAGENMLAESHRILRPGGRIRLATPDVMQMVRLMLPMDAESERYVRESNATFLADRPDLSAEPLVAVNRMFRNYGHRFLYDESFLHSRLEANGFQDITRCAVGESDDKNFVDMEEHGRHIGDFCNHFETLILEATRC